jgi:RNA polymerase sigma factor (sigma-70 family)
MARVVHELQRAAIQSGPEPSDADLLNAFLERRDEIAFEMLLRRHGPLVLGVCRRLAGNEEDAADAFQAVFLVLVQRARSIRSRVALGSWLYGVAYRASLKARAKLKRRQTWEIALPNIPEREVEMPIPTDDMLAILDEELNMLPEKYRAPVVLCELQGQPRSVAAKALKIPEGTLSSRLATARRMLRARLLRRGIAPAVGALATGLASPTAKGAIPAHLLASTIKIAAITAGGWVTAGAVSARVLAIKDGIVKAMLMSKLRISMLFLAAVVLAATCTGLIAHQVVAAMQQKSPADNAEPSKLNHADSADTRAKLADAEMHVIGLYGPKGLTGNNKRVDVEVRSIAKPVVLVLTSYYTVDWHLRLAPHAQLRQIILGGANEQTIEGVPERVPVVRCFPKDHTDRARLWFYAYDPKSSEYQEMVRKLNEMTALPVASFQGEYETTSLVVDGKRGSHYAQRELKPPAVTRRELRADQILAAAAGAELHVVAISKPREPGEPVDVEVRKTAKPVVLALTSGPHQSGSTTWKVKLAEGARLKLVVLGGCASEIEGLPADVPVVDRRRFYSHFQDFDWRRDSGLLFPPGNYRSSVYLVSDHRADTFLYRRMVESLTSLTVLPITSFQGKEIGISFVIDGVKGREFEQTKINSAHATLKPQELLTAAKGCELHIVGVGSPKDDQPVNVEVRSTAKPVVLVLTSRVSVLWKLQLAEGARLKAVILGGWREQDIEGVPAGIPVIHRTYYPDDGSRRQEGYFWANLGDSIGYRETARKLNAITGLPVGSFQGAAAGTSFLVDGTRGSQFAEREIQPNPVQPPSLTPKDLLAAAAGCELHYVSVSGPKGSLNSSSESVAVEVRRTATPVVVVLSSHLPVVWKFKLGEKAKVKAVILAGFHKAEIDGLAADIPVVDRSLVSSSFPTTDAARSTSELCTCQWGSIEHRRMMQMLNAMTGLLVSTCQGETFGTSFVIDGVSGSNFGQKEMRPRPPAPRALKPEELLAAATGAELHVVGTYWSEIGSAEERVAGNAGGVVQVEVRPTDKPVVLVLTSWYSVVWKLKVADKARVKAVILGGGYEQEIEEVPLNIPVVSLPCGRANFPTYESNCPEFRNLTQTLRKMTGLPVSTFQGTVAGISFVVDGIRGRDFAKKPDKPAGKEPDDPLADVADIPSQELQAAGDTDKRYFLIGPKKNARPPAEGYGLVVIMPGGDGSADFNPFVKRIHKHALPDRYLAAQPVALRWTPDQQIVWPTKTNPVAKMKFSTEEFVEAVIADVSKKHRLDRTRVFTLSWSSSGPAAYAISLQNKRSVTGSFIAMSVFNPQFLPSLKGAKGHAYYLYHSDEDRACPYRMAEQAKSSLAENGAKVRLETYEGGHGWRGDVYNDIRNGVEWLEKNR